jgi:imidazolonepropionase-like amidohydrolase
MSAQRASATEASADHGRFVLHKFQQPIGEETYEVRRTDQEVRFSIHFSFSDRGEKVPLEATFTGGSDLSPISFAVDGKNCRQCEIHRGAEVRGDRLRLREQDRWTEVHRPAQFFTVAGYAPVTLQELLLRYWSSHGTPPDLAIPPTGGVRILHRGQDTISLGAKTAVLDRYSIEGLIWGRETAWIDSNRALVALVSIDAEFDHFEALRDGYETGLDQFVRSAGADGMAALSDLGRRISGGSADSLAIVHGYLIDGTGRPPIPNATVVLQGGRIVTAGPSEAVPLPARATVLDAQGLSILPGLWDMHAHFQQVEWGPIYLAAGVTTVRDCANELEFITSVRDAIAEGRGLGPRILAAGVVDGSGPYAVGIARVESPEQAESWVDRYRRAGFQQMKLYSSLSLESVRAVATAAHRAGMTVTGHVPIGLDARQTIEAGQDQVNHLWSIATMFMDALPVDTPRLERLRAYAGLDLDSVRVRDAIEFLVRHGTVLDPTVVLSELATVTTVRPPESFEPGAAKVAREISGRLANVEPPSALTELQEAVFRKGVALVAALHRAGVPIVAGTDQAVPGHSLHREIELYTEAGFTPMEALQSATSVPAHVMGLASESGTVEPGKRADLILVRGNPLDRIRDIRNVRTVIAAGKVYACDELWRAVGFTP